MRAWSAGSIETVWPNTLFEPKGRRFLREAGFRTWGDLSRLPLFPLNRPEISDPDQAKPFSSVD